jgi:hypothetical protein
MTTKQERLDVLPVAKLWWYNQDSITQYEYCNEYFKNIFELTNKTYDEISDGQIVYMYLHEFYNTVKKLQTK